jgi:hypothetical protein
MMGEEVEATSGLREIVVVAIVAVLKVEGLNLEVLRLTVSSVPCCSYAESILRLPYNPETQAGTSSSDGNANCELTGLLIQSSGFAVDATERVASATLVVSKSTELPT